MTEHPALHPPRPRRLVAVLLTVALAVLGLAGCGSGSSDPSSSSGSSASSGVQKLPITINGDTITPINKRVEVSVDKPLTITITSDRSGELHLHSSPEQHIDFGKGTTTKTITLKVPGVVELEEHQSDTLLAQLEVR